MIYLESYPYLRMESRAEGCLCMAAFEDDACCGLYATYYCSLVNSAVQKETDGTCTTRCLFQVFLSAPHI